MKCPNCGIDPGQVTTGKCACPSVTYYEVDESGKAHETTPAPPCRPAWCLELAEKFLQDYFGNWTGHLPEVLANLLDDAYLRGRREERGLKQAEMLHKLDELLRFHKMMNPKEEP